ncbi:MAG TPA: hypothetical protein VFM12_00995, partial [Gemmatimonadales bacterium]|nr:hypothetical protein [Gemmatimonadales bacterium]
MTIARRSLRSQLVAELVLVASAAVVLVGVITALVAGANLSALVLPLVSFWAGSTLVLLVFGLHLLRRQVLRPLEQLAEEADALNAERSAPGAQRTATEYETGEFQELSERFRAMAEGL